MQRSANQPRHSDSGLISKNEILQVKLSEPDKCEIIVPMKVNNTTSVNLKFAQLLRDTIREVHNACSIESGKSLEDKFRINNIQVVYDNSLNTSNNDVTTTVVNMPLAEALGKLMLKEHLTIEELVLQVRDQTIQDPRPNKRIEPEVLTYLYQGYKHHDLMVDMATYGYDPVFSHETPVQRHRPSNHKSAQTGVQALAKFVRGGQDDGSLLVLPDSMLKDWDTNPNVRIHISPYGVVPKKGEVTSTDGRPIADLSFPRGVSVNDFTPREHIPQTDWRPASAVGRRIHELAILSGWSADHANKSQIRGFVGDIHAAFRHATNRANHVKWFVFHIPDLNILVLDMCAPFGWRASPMFYGVYGNGITWAVQRESPHTLNPLTSHDTTPFFCYEWVDDFVLLELNDPPRLEAAETALRLAMTLTLGHTAIHPKKFSETWEKQIHYLGLDFCLLTCTVSMPMSKIDKARGRVLDMLKGTTITKNRLQKLLGSLRHVSTCIPAAKPFYQRLQNASKMPSDINMPMTPDIMEDCYWFLAILHEGHLQSVPVSIFADMETPRFHFYSDACDSALVVLNPTTKQYIWLQFDELEKEAILRIKVQPRLVGFTDKSAKPYTSTTIRSTSLTLTMISVST